MYMKNTNLKRAFTIAEMIIVFCIISVLSVLFMKSLNRSSEKTEAVVKLQRAYEDITKAVANGIVENGNVDYWDFTLSPADFMSTYLKTLKIVNTQTETFSNVLSKNKYYDLSGSEAQDYRIITNSGNTLVYTLKNGSQLIVNNSAAGTTSGDSDINEISMWVDVNGSSKKPNTIGKDTFPIVLISDGRVLLPTWTEDETINATTVKPRDTLLNDATNGCNMNASGYWCGALIRADGWKISKDYPWDTKKE